jgi:CRP-like cAMP-binding protein
MKKFYLDIIQRIEYYNGISPEALLKVIFSMEPRQYEKGEVLMREEDNADSMIFVQNGILEMYTTFEGNEFILETLYRGSCLNYRSFFMQDLMYVYVRCATPVNLVELK